MRTENDRDVILQVRDLVQQQSRTYEEELPCNDDSSSFRLAMGYGKHS